MVKKIKTTPAYTPLPLPESETLISRKFSGLIFGEVIKHFSSITDSFNYYFLH